MTRIHFPKQPIKLRVPLTRYYSQTTPEQRMNILETYEGLYHAIQTALYVSSLLFDLYILDLPRAIHDVERMCEYSLGDVLLFDHDLAASEIWEVLISMSVLTTDIYVAVNSYAQHLLNDGYDIKDITDLIGDTHWEIFSDTTKDLDDADEIYLVIEQSVSEWMNSNGK